MKWGYSMPKKPNLAEAFNPGDELQPKPQLKVVETNPTETAEPKKKHIGGYFSIEVYQQMKHLGVELNMTTQDILREGLNAVFRMHDKPPIA